MFLVDDLGRLVPAIETASRSRTIAHESAYAGIVPSVAGMICAPLYHAANAPSFLQEVIDAMQARKSSAPSDG